MLTHRILATGLATMLAVVPVLSVANATDTVVVEQTSSAGDTHMTVKAAIKIMKQQKKQGSSSSRSKNPRAAANMIKKAVKKELKTQTTIRKLIEKISRRSVRDATKALKRRNNQIIHGWKSSKSSSKMSSSVSSVSSMSSVSSSVSSMSSMSSSSVSSSSSSSSN